MSLTREDAKSRYDGIISGYGRLGENLTIALKEFLTSAEIDVLGTTYRLKIFDSFWEKWERKAVSDPFEEIEDDLPPVFSPRIMRLSPVFVRPT